jgi:MFS family permease
MTLACGMAGAVAGQAPLALAVATFGWRATLAGAGALGLLIALALWRSLPAGRPAAAEDGAGARLGRGLRQAVRRRQTWLMALFGATMSVPVLTFGALWGVPYLVAAYAVDRATAALVTSAMMVAWGVGSMGTGWLSDRLGRRRLPMVVSALASTGCFAWAFLEPGHGFLGLSALVVAGGLAGGGMVLAFAAGREHVPPDAAGATMGVINTGVMMGGAVMQPMIGILLDRQWDGTLEAGRPIYDPEAYRLAFLSLPLLLAVAALAAALGRDRPASPGDVADR